ncbi:MAG: right-handed parallel beta-helix repeat-containing protein [Candidatus Eisenbacteria bacterium]|nr:right-handed parallel beta-helix repeat-containing protein [Candidatus Eisenbacteria bacterium]
MATEFVCSIRASGGDYTTVTLWQAGCVCDLTAAATKVFSGAVTGSISDGATVTLYRGGASQSVTGTAKHDTATQILVTSISDTEFSFQWGDEWRVDVSNLFTISNAGDSVIAVAELYNDWASGLVDNPDITGWTTSATNYVIIRASASSGTEGQSKHNGTAGTGVKIRPTGSGQFYPIFDVNIDHCRLYDFIIDANGNPTTQQVIGLRVTGAASSAVASAIYVERMIYKGDADLTGGLQRGMYSSPAGSRTADHYVYFRNCLSYDCHGDSGSYAGIFIFDNLTPRQSHVEIDNCACIDSTGYGIYGYAPGEVIVRNCYCGGNTTGDFGGYFNGGAGDSLTSATCASSDATLAGAPWSSGSGHKTSQTPSFLDAGGEDYHLQSGDTALKDAGTDLSAYFTTDIDGITRSGTWDIGPDEYVSGATQYPVTIGETGRGSDAYDIRLIDTTPINETARVSDAWEIGIALPAPTDIHTNETWDTAQSGDHNPSGITDRTPVFSALVEGVDANITHVQVQVASTKEFAPGDMEYDSGWLELATPIAPTGGRTEDIEYGRA